MYPSELKYSKEHEWVRLSDDSAVIGITHHAQEQLGDVVYVELPKVGGQISQSEPFGVVESVKSASDLYAPLSGRVSKVNDRLGDNPELVNDDPYGEGWMIEITISEASELSDLLDAEQYQTSLPQD